MIEFQSIQDEDSYYDERPKDRKISIPIKVYDSHLVADKKVYVDTNSDNEETYVFDKVFIVGPFRDYIDVGVTFSFTREAITIECSDSNPGSADLNVLMLCFNAIIDAKEIPGYMWDIHKEKYKSWLA